MKSSSCVKEENQAMIIYMTKGTAMKLSLRTLALLIVGFRYGYS
jgi:hypothetical protein